MPWPESGTPASAQARPRWKNGIRGDRPQARRLELAIIVVLANRVRAAARAAGLGDGFTEHSGRIGMVRRMVVGRAPNAPVQRQGRWKNGNMVARYTRD